MTAYSSTRDQTDGDPFTTASGAKVKDGIIAMNGVPFGTKIRIPEKYGDKVFVVQDRMAARHGSYRADIWMKTRTEAKQWGVRRVKVEFVK
jgi:3D (Asp-Asp-Asp) domain-containing protein